jgi:hypothetical protein
MKVVAGKVTFLWLFCFPLSESSSESGKTQADSAVCITQGEAEKAASPSVF